MIYRNGRGPRFSRYKPCAARADQITVANFCPPDGYCSVCGTVASLYHWVLFGFKADRGGTGLIRRHKGKEIKLCPFNPSQAALPMIPAYSSVCTAAALTAHGHFKSLRVVALIFFFREAPLGLWRNLAHLPAPLPVMHLSRPTSGHLHAYTRNLRRVAHLAESQEVADLRRCGSPFAR